MRDTGKTAGKAQRLATALSLLLHTAVFFFIVSSHPFHPAGDTGSGFFLVELTEHPDRVKIAEVQTDEDRPAIKADPEPEQAPKPDTPDKAEPPDTSAPNTSAPDTPPPPRRSESAEVKKMPVQPVKPETPSPPVEKHAAARPDTTPEKAPQPEPPPRADRTKALARWRSTEGTVNISSDKTLPAVRPDPNGPTVTVAGAIGTNDTVKHGSEIRSLSGVIGYDYDVPDFAGDYRVGDRKICIIDDREHSGEVLMHDPQTGSVQSLKRTEYAKNIYTYTSPETGEVEGTVLFLPSIREEVYRFVWIPKDPPAVYPQKILYDRTPLSIPVAHTDDSSGGGRVSVDAVLTIPPKPVDYSEQTIVKDPYAEQWKPAPVAVIAPSPDCSTSRLDDSLARLFADEGIALLRYTPRGCEDGQADPASYEADLLRILLWISQHEDIDSDRVGLWGRDVSAAPAIQAALSAQDRAPDFLISSWSSPDGSALLAPPSPPDIARLTCPALLMISGSGLEQRWQARLRAISAAPGQSAREIAILPWRNAPSVEGADSELEAFSHLAGHYARTVGKWLQKNLPPEASP